MSRASVIGLESRQEYSYGVTDLTGTYSANEHVDHVEREVLFLRALETLVILDQVRSKHPDDHSHRLEVETSGATQEYFLTVVQARGALDPDLAIDLVESPEEWVVTLTLAGKGSAKVLFEKGKTTSGGGAGFAVTGTPVIAPFRAGVQGFVVTSSGPTWQE